MIQQRASSFIWDLRKELINVKKHGVDFHIAAQAFFDPGRKIFTDSKHSEKEPRYFCIGRVEEKVLTVRFTYRGSTIRIIGAGYWRKGVNYYEQKD